MLVENKLNEISKNAKAISRKRLTKHSRKIFSYHNGSKTIYYLYQLKIRYIP